jgi:uncharacterized protein YbaR (Trm112 family)
MRQVVSEILPCPRCKQSLTALAGPNRPRLRCNNDECGLSHTEFPVLHDVPILIDFSSSILDEHEFVNTEG